MKTKQLFWVFLALYLMVSCQDKEVLFYGNSSIQGYVYSLDTNEIFLPEKISKKEIFLSDKSNDPNYFLYKTITNDEGFYNIEYLPAGKNQEYYIYSKFVIDDSIEYFGESKAIKVNEEEIYNYDLYVYPKIDNGLKIQLIDSLGTSINNFSLWIYINEIAANNDDTSFAIRQSKTNENGIYKLYNITPTRYFIVAKDSLAENLITGRESVLIEEKGIISKTVIVK